MRKTEFHYEFQITRLVIFEVSYYTLSTNQHPYFATSARHYVRSKMGVDTCGQCQKHVLSGEAMRFWRKWDELHLHDLSEEKYAELRRDIDALCEVYNYDKEERDSFAGTSWHMPESRLKALSMMPLKGKKRNM